MTAGAVDIKHGTYSGYQQHNKRNIEPCSECRAAQAAYMRRNRAMWPVTAARNKSKQYARDRALRRLAEIHPADLQALYADELDRVGLM